MATTGYKLLWNGDNVIRVADNQTAPSGYTAIPQPGSQEYITSGLGNLIESGGNGWVKNANTGMYDPPDGGYSFSAQKAAQDQSAKDQSAAQKKSMDALRKSTPDLDAKMGQGYRLQWDANTNNYTLLPPAQQSLKAQQDEVSKRITGLKTQLQQANKDAASYPAGSPGQKAAQKKISEIQGYLDKQQAQYDDLDQQRKAAGETLTQKNQSGATDRAAQEIYGKQITDLKAQIKQQQDLAASLKGKSTAQANAALKKAAELQKTLSETQAKYDKYGASAEQKEAAASPAPATASAPAAQPPTSAQPVGGGMPIPGTSSGNNVQAAANQGSPVSNVASASPTSTAPVSPTNTTTSTPGNIGSSGVSELGPDSAAKPSAGGIPLNAEAQARAQERTQTAAPTPAPATTNTAAPAPAPTTTAATTQTATSAPPATAGGIPMQDSSRATAQARQTSDQQTAAAQQTPSQPTSPPPPPPPPATNQPAPQAASTSTATQGPNISGLFNELKNTLTSTIPNYDINKADQITGLGGATNAAVDAYEAQRGNMPEIGETPQAQAVQISASPDQMQSMVQVDGGLQTTAPQPIQATQGITPDSLPVATAQQTQQAQASQAQAQPSSVAEQVKQSDLKNLNGNDYGYTADTSATAKAVAGQMQGATGTVTPEQTVQGQLTQLLDFAPGEVPTWLKGAYGTAMQQMAARGLTSSSIMGEAVTAAMIKAAFPIASQDAQTYKEMALANLSNEQQARVINSQSRLQAILSDQAAANTALQTNAANKLQADETMAQIVANVATTNVAQKNAMEQLNAQQKQQVELANAAAETQVSMANAQTAAETERFNVSEQNKGAATLMEARVQASQFNAQQINEAAKYNASMQAQVDQFNATLEAARRQFNATMAAQIDQANVQWRRQIATQNQAAQMEANLANAQIAANMTTTEYNAKVQEFRDYGKYLFDAGINTDDNTNKYVSQMIGVVSDTLNFLAAQMVAAYSAAAAGMTGNAAAQGQTGGLGGDSDTLPGADDTTPGGNSTIPGGAATGGTGATPGGATGNNGMPGGSATGGTSTVPGGGSTGGGTTTTTGGGGTTTTPGGGGTSTVPGGGTTTNPGGGTTTTPGDTTTPGGSTSPGGSTAGGGLGGIGGGITVTPGGGTGGTSTGGGSTSGTGGSGVTITPGGGTFNGGSGASGSWDDPDKKPGSGTVNPSTPGTPSTPGAPAPAPADNDTPPPNPAAQPGATLPPSPGTPGGATVVDTKKDPSKPNTQPVYPENGASFEPGVTMPSNYIQSGYIYAVRRTPQGFAIVVKNRASGDDAFDQWAFNNPMELLTADEMRKVQSGGAENLADYNGRSDDRKTALQWLATDGRNAFDPTTGQQYAYDKDNNSWVFEAEPGVWAATSNLYV